MSLDEWNEAVRSKVNASWNLHNSLGPDLDFFILLSSTMGVAGNPEQSNYAAGSTFQDALARHLASQGIHAVSLDLPVILGVGFVAEKPELLNYMRSIGWAFMDENESMREALLAKNRISGVAPLTPLDKNNKLTNQVANRIYDIRCRIVHAKEDGGPSGNPEVLLPFSAEADLLDPDVMLVRYVAQKVIIAGRRGNQW